MKPKWVTSNPVEIECYIPPEEPKKLSLLDGLELMDKANPSPKPLITAAKKVEKKKEKKKKKSMASSIAIEPVDVNSITVATDPLMMDYVEAFRNSFDSDDDDDDFDEIVKEQKGTRKTKATDDVEKEFSNNLGLLYNLLDDSKKFEKKLERKYDEMDNAKLRGISKYTTDMAGAVIQARRSTLDVIKEITATKKAISDIRLKVEKSKSVDVQGQNSSVLASNFLSSIMNGYGRGNLMKDINHQSSFDGDYEDEDDIGDMITELKTRASSNLMYDNINDEIEKRLNEGDNPFRSDEASAYIQYEHLQPQIKVKRCIDTQEWEMIAVDKDNQEIPTYPIPTSASIGKMTFSADGLYATDAKGRSYQVVSYFTPQGQ